MTDPKKPVDWQAVEAEYRSGSLSNRLLAEKHGVSEGAVRKKAKTQGWPKDLTKAVREAVRSELVRTEVRTPNVGEREIIESAAATGAQVVRTHRKDIRSAADLVGLLMSQLADAVVGREELEQAIEEEVEGDEGPVKYQRRAKLMRAVSLQSHAAIARDLSTAAKNLVGLERQAYNLDEKPDEDSYDERLVAIIGRSQ